MVNLVHIHIYFSEKKYRIFNTPNATDELLPFTCDLKKDFFQLRQSALNRNEDR